ncbi:MAG TPA: hypothetical protein ENG42_02300 [Candidatus Aenigmarchaeota archaeon]|nr:hypothetical protein [Candidatus Aenigmarchaeota archaeon]
MVKGQLEFVAIAAVLIISVVALLYASQKGYLPTISGQSEEQKLVKDSVSSLVTNALRDTLNKIYERGGYLDSEKVTSIDYGLNKIAVWQACDNVADIDIKGEIKRGVEAYLRSVLKGGMEFYGKNVTFELDKMSTEINIKSGGVEAKVTIPSYISGTKIPQPYIGYVESRLKDILDFSKDFSQELSDKRFFETITLETIFYSNPESEYWLPITGEIVGCGKTLIMNRNDMLKAMKALIKYTVQHAVIGEKRPPRTNNNLFYYITGTERRRYKLEVAFQYPDEWELAKNFYSSPDSLVVIPKPISEIIPYCVSSYYVKYSVRYPVIVMVKDEKLKQWFRFAVIVEIDENKPGNCTFEIEEYEDEYTGLCINNADCLLEINVTDMENKPIGDAKASFYICDLGKTNESGLLTARIPCTTSEILVNKEGYMSYGDIINPKFGKLNKVSVHLNKAVHNIDVHIFGVEMQAHSKVDTGVYGSYEVKGIKPINESFGSMKKRDMIAFIHFQPMHRNYITAEDIDLFITNMNEKGEVVSDVKLPFAYPSEFTMIASVISNETHLRVGTLNYSLTLVPKKDIYIYLPVITTADEEPLKESISTSERGKIAQTIKDCDIEIVSYREQEVRC